MRLSNPVQWEQAKFVITNCPVTFLPALKIMANARLKALESDTNCLGASTCGGCDPSCPAAPKTQDRIAPDRPSGAPNNTATQLQGVIAELKYVESVVGQYGVVAGSRCHEMLLRSIQQLTSFSYDNVIRKTVL